MTGTLSKSEVIPPRTAKDRLTAAREKSGGLYGPAQWPRANCKMQNTHAPSTGNAGGAPFPTAGMAGQYHAHLFPPVFARPSGRVFFEDNTMFDAVSKKHPSALFMLLFIFFLPSFEVPESPFAFWVFGMVWLAVLARIGWGK